LGLLHSAIDDQYVDSPVPLTLLLPGVELLVILAVIRTLAGVVANHWVIVAACGSSEFVIRDTIPEKYLHHGSRTVCREPPVGNAILPLNFRRCPEQMA